MVLMDEPAEHIHALDRACGPRNLVGCPGTARPSGGEVQCFWLGSGPRRETSPADWSECRRGKAACSRGVTTSETSDGRRNGRERALKGGRARLAPAALDQCQYVHGREHGTTGQVRLLEEELVGYPRGRRLSP
jgi:hypothetical protein